MGFRTSRGGGGSFLKGRLLIGLLFIAFAVFKFYTNTQVNPVTGEEQRISMTPEQEMTLGVQSAPQMAQQHGGLHPDEAAQELVDKVGHLLLDTPTARKSTYQYDFHLLADDQTVNAFALPGGQIFITAALFNQLQNEDQLAGVLGHEIGHVIERHSAERIAKQELTQGITNAAVIASGDYSAGQMAQYISNIVNMKYGQGQELESDDWGIRLMMESGYNPEQMIGVMAILKKASGGKSSGFFSTHPDPDDRAAKIQASIDKYEQMGI